MTETRSVTVEREVPFPPEKVWRALTQPELIADWLMDNDFRAEAGHKFTLSGEWGSVDCAVRDIEPYRSLSYSWTAFGLDSVVTWTLTPTSGGTHLRMEQSGFAPDQTQFYQGAAASWPKFVSELEAVLARLG